MISHYVRSKIMGLFGTAFGAVKWGFGTNFSHIGRWLLLTIFSCIPIVNFIADGALMKVLKGEEPDISPAGKSFVTGFFFFLIGLIYAIIPAIIILVLGLISSIAAAIVGIILVILLCLIAIPAEINFVRSGKFGKAFAFGEIFGMISKLGWGKYILAIIVMFIVGFIVSLVIGIIAYVLGLIPVAGWVLALIFEILMLVPLVCFELKYWNDVLA